MLIARTFLRIFVLFVFGAPLLFIVGDIVEQVDRYFDRGLTVGEVATAYVYMLPEFISWSFPIAALIAAVFTIHSMTQHREVLAAKAGGISFHRLMAPLVVVGLVLTGAGLILSEVVPVAKRRSGQILRSEEVGRQWRTDFVFKTDDDRTLTVRRLNVFPPSMTQVLLEVPAGSDGEAAQHLQATRAPFDSVRGWTFENGYLRILPDRAAPLTFYFDSLRSSGFGEPPRGLLAQPDDEGRDDRLRNRPDGGQHHALGRRRERAVGREGPAEGHRGSDVGDHSVRCTTRDELPAGGGRLRNRDRAGVDDPLPAPVPVGGSGRPVRSPLTGTIRLASQHAVSGVRTHPSQAGEDLSARPTSSSAFKKGDRKGGWAALRMPRLQLLGGATTP